MIEDSVTKLCKMTIGNLADASVFFFHFSGMTEERSVEEVVRIFIEADVE